MRTVRINESQEIRVARMKIYKYIEQGGEQQHNRPHERTRMYSSDVRYYCKFKIPERREFAATAAAAAAACLSLEIGRDSHVLALRVMSQRSSSRRAWNLVNEQKHRSAGCGGALSIYLLAVALTEMVDVRS